MVYELVTFGGIIFWLLAAAFLLWIAGALYTDCDGYALLAGGLFVLLVFGFTSNLPALSWYYFAAYIGGALIWLPTYWYLELRANRRHLIAATSDGHRKRYGRLHENKWLPDHPASSELTAVGTLWFVSAPVYLAHDWIRIFIDLIKDQMDKIQLSLAVDAPPPPEPVNPRPQQPPGTWENHT